MRTLLILLISAALLSFAACGHRAAPRATDPAATQRPRRFEPASAPVRLVGEERDEWIRRHYWDPFDFTDTLFLAEADTADMVQAYALYIMLISNRPTDGTPIDSLMRRASTSRRMHEYFAWLGTEVLHDPNSPLRNDEYYIPVLNSILQSPWYDEYERIAPRYDLKIASQNRIGAQANDFRYTLASGAVGRLYRLQADYILIFINNPGCPLCREIREAITASPMISEMTERGSLVVLAIYPDSDLTEWQHYRNEIPAAWINGYDAGCRIREQDLYDLRAIPALYLLDRDKRVLVKDAIDVSLIEEVIDRAEQHS